MPRVIQHPTRDSEDPTTPDSDKSFVSAESTSKKTTLVDSTNEDVIDRTAKGALSSSRCTVEPATSAIQKDSLFSPHISTRPSLSQPSPSVESYFTLQPGTSDPDRRSPPSRRPPASRSSHGIETKSGPPPALSTQRSYTISSRRNPSPNGRVLPPPQKVPPNPREGTKSTTKPPHDIVDDRPQAQGSNPARAIHSRPSTSDGVMTSSGMRSSIQAESDEERDSTVRFQAGHLGPENGETRSRTQNNPQSSHEDLFLDLARDDSVVDEPVKKSDRQRSRAGTSSFSQARMSRPSSSGRLSTSGASFGTYPAPIDQKHFHQSSFESSSPGRHSLASLRDASSRNRPYAASAHPLDQRHWTRSARSSLGNTAVGYPDDYATQEMAMPYGRRSSLREPSLGVATRDYKQSNVAYASNGGRASSPVRFSPAYGQDTIREQPPLEGTESTVSTTAPSTVWDELEDLKSRLRKLELTGPLPKSSNAAMSTVNGNRPPTATTTVTTISTSPKRQRMSSTYQEASAPKTSTLPNPHPLLHSALGKAKSRLSPNLHQALEATASDALALAAMTGTTSSQGASPSPESVVGPLSGIDRQLQRKADSMCRSLTELCIALAEEPPGEETSRPQSGSADASSKQTVLPKSKASSGPVNDSETRTSSRVLSRLEARRASLLSSSPSSGRRGSAQEITTPTQVSTPASSRIERSSSTFLRKRSNDEELDTANGRRPPSRAATEVGQVRPSAQTRISREYTSQHPLPGSPQQSPSMQSSVPTRKSYFASATSSPLTPSVQPGNRRYLDRSTPPSSADSARLAEARQRRIASLGQGQSRIGISSGRLRQSEPE